MNADTLNLILSLAGLLLGVISAYGQIKRIFQAAAKRGLEGARRWIEQREAENTVYANYPSAFLAYSVKRLLTALALLLVLPFSSALIKANSLGLPPLLVSSLSFVLPTLCGLQLGALLSRSSDVLNSVLTREKMPSKLPTSTDLQGMHDNVLTKHVSN